ncbi:MAG: hypothetical protein GY723_20885 [bacterium]|nr:hypothetical protein [bacterium]MCP5068364.1 hypothetical protein [bacterium]
MVSLALGLAACSTAPPTPPSAGVPGAATPWTPELLERAEALAATLTEDPPGQQGTLRVRLAFEDEVDLDLFVSDPLQETVYFANDRSGSGGRLDRDVRCGMPGPRIENVDFDRPLTGRYRVGVDFPRRCNGRGGGPAPFAIAVERGGSRTLQRGVISAGIFLPIVDRFDVR